MTTVQKTINNEKDELRQNTVNSNSQLIRSLKNENLTRVQKKEIIKKSLNGFTNLRQIGLSDCQKTKQILNSH